MSKIILLEITKKLNNIMGVTTKVNKFGLFRVVHLLTDEFGGWVNPENIIVKDDVFLKSGEFYGGNFYGGNIFQIGKYIINVSSPTKLTIGCTTKKLSWWLRRGERYVEEIGLTKIETVMYKKIVLFIAEHWEDLAPMPITVEDVQNA